jgi:lysophospholipase L1-like esterase
MTTQHIARVHTVRVASSVSCPTPVDLRPFQIGSNMSKPLGILAFGDSLTAGYCDRGFSMHPYSRRLNQLFAESNVPTNIDEKGVSGELVNPSMTRRLKSLLADATCPDYDWIIILGGTNDLANNKSSDEIFDRGLESMYDAVLSWRRRTTQLVIVTVPENGCLTDNHPRETTRQQINEFIRHLAANHSEKERIRLVDLDRDIPYHQPKHGQQRHLMWDDPVHFTPTGYDHMGALIFGAINGRH